MIFKFFNVCLSFHGTFRFLTIIKTLKEKNVFRHFWSTVGRIRIRVSEITCDQILMIFFGSAPLVLNYCLSVVQWLVGAPPPSPENCIGKL